MVTSGTIKAQCNGGKALAKKRHMVGLTATALAHEIGVEPWKIKHFEAGLYDLDAATRERAMQVIKRRAQKTADALA